MARTSLMTLILLSPASARIDVEFGLLFDRGSSGGSAGQQQQRRPERQPKRPTSLRAASRARKPRGRSGREVVYDFGEISHFDISLVRSGFLTAWNRLMRLRPFRHVRRTRGRAGRRCCRIDAMRVAGVLDHATSLARSSSSDGRVASALTLFGVEPGLAHRAAENDELVILSWRNRPRPSARSMGSCVGDERLTLEQIDDVFGLRALKSKLGQAVLRDFDGAAGLRIFVRRSFICATVRPA
jgi:hypothetical protein